MQLKKLSIIILLASLYLQSSSQSLLPTRYGFKAGINISNLNITNVEGVDPAVTTSQIGLAAGACFYIPLSEKWHLSPEILYTQKGASFIYNLTHDYAVNQRKEFINTSQITLSYAQLNTSVTFKASEKIAINIGPTVSFLIGEKYSIDPSIFSVGTNYLTTDNLLNTESLEVGINTGLSYFITENFISDLRVFTGFLKAAKVIQPYESSNSDLVPEASYTIKNRAIIVSLAYLF